MPRQFWVRLGMDLHSNSYAGVGLLPTPSAYRLAVPNSMGYAIQSGKPLLLPYIRLYTGISITYCYG